MLQLAGPMPQGMSTIAAEDTGLLIRAVETLMFSIHHDIVFSSNRVRLTNARTGQTLDRTATQPFSSAQRLLGDPAAASKFVFALLRECDRHRLWRIWPTTSVTFDGPWTEVDRQEVRRLLIDLGFARVHMP
jgi:hypothetical protein